MDRITPYSAGIPAENISKFIEKLEENNLSTHDVILARGNNIFFEAYWKPFCAGMTHRMYSVSKSIVAIAVGFALQDGLLSLDDPICKFFPDECAGCDCEELKNQTVRHMLMMSTARSPKNWFARPLEDRVKFYFENSHDETVRPSGTVFEYDSTGSFILCAMVERLCKMPFMDYLRVKLFDKIGVSSGARCLKCPGGHSWGDSAVLCTPRDLLKIARFVMNRGLWNGEQILDKKYLTDACSSQIDSNVSGLYDYESCGYGYLIWRTVNNSFFFNGMGSQYAICVPDKDLIMIINSDNQGKPNAQKIIMDGFFELIANPMSDCALPENPNETKALNEYANTLTLAAARGETHSPFSAQISGKKYVLRPNPMGITDITPVFDANGGCITYTNAQGLKSIEFGMCENRFGTFPEDGYSDKTGSVKCPGHKYRCCASAAWVEPQKLFIKVQIIDDYFGNLNITLSYKDSALGVYMEKHAEAFLDEYSGYGYGECE